MKPLAVLILLGPALSTAAGQVREYNLTLQATYMSKGTFGETTKCNTVFDC